MTLRSSSGPIWPSTQHPADKTGSPASCGAQGGHDMFLEQPGPVGRLRTSLHVKPRQRFTPSTTTLEPMACSHVRPGVGMFDAFIINRIRREQRRDQERRLPLHIEAPRSPSPPAGDSGGARSNDAQPRGTWVDDGWTDSSWSDNSRDRRPAGDSPESHRGIVDIDFNI